MLKNSQNTKNNSKICGMKAQPYCCSLMKPVSTGEDSAAGHTLLFAIYILPFRQVVQRKTNKAE